MIPNICNYAVLRCQAVPSVGGALHDFGWRLAKMASMAEKRIAEERKSWRKTKPFGFHARPETGADGCVVDRATLLFETSDTITR